MKLLKRAMYALGAAALFLLLSSCEMLSIIGLEGNVRLFVTDAKVDQSTVDGVYVTITGIAYNRTDGENIGWHDVEGFGDPVLINLLDLSNGAVEELDAFTVPMGNYNQIKFYIDAPKFKEDAPLPLTSYITFNDGTPDAPLYIDGDGEPGFSAAGKFTVHVNGEVSLIADFDLRKSIVVASGLYKLKPVIRLLDNAECGSIEGHAYGPGKYHTVIVHAYKKGSYNMNEAKDPKKEAVRFANAVSSAKVDKMIDGDASDYEYILPFLEPDEYDLIVTSYDEDGNFTGVVSDPKTEYKNIKVRKREEASEPLFL